jgi:hypothetical protein
MDDIGYSDAIAQASSIALGLFEEDSIETVHRRRVDILKGRYGEVGHFLVHWLWHPMDFGEHQEVAVAELQYL